MSDKAHWEGVYQNKSDEQVSWTQNIPPIVLGTMQKLGVDKYAQIIDVGAGNSQFVDYLLELGYQNITVLDISSVAIEKAKLRLGQKSEKITWLIADITRFVPAIKYDIWHDRAVFHFLTDESDRRFYKKTISNYLQGYFFISTFAKDGPDSCSGLPVIQYDKTDLIEMFDEEFELINSCYESHITPFQTIQKFTFCCFKKIIF